jgi:hypothetical protein
MGNSERLTRDVVGHCSFPHRQNINEQLLVLHEANWDLDEAIAFADLNWNFSGDMTPENGTPAELLRRSASASRRQSLAAGEGVATDKPDTASILQGGELTPVGARRIDELEQLVG